MQTANRFAHALLRRTEATMPHSINPKAPPRPCTAHDLTWGPKGAQCLNCGSESEHSFDLKHSPRATAQQILADWNFAVRAYRTEQRTD